MSEPTFNIGVNTKYGRAETGDLTRDHKTLAGCAPTCCWAITRAWRSITTVTPTILMHPSPAPPPSMARWSPAMLPPMPASRSNWRNWPTNGGSDPAIRYSASAPAAAYYQADLDTMARGSLDGVSGTASDSRSDNAIAPLLEVGVRTALSDNVRLYAEASGVKKNGGNINGHIYNGNVGVEWFPFKNVGIGADYGITKIQLYRDSANYEANLASSWSGLALT